MPGKKDRLVIWPVYFDVAKSRGQGRMVSKKFAVKEPKLEEIAHAAAEIGLLPDVERNKRYPGQWYERPGRVLVAKKGSKSAALRSIARTVSKRRR